MHFRVVNLVNKSAITHWKISPLKSWCWVSAGARSEQVKQWIRVTPKKMWSFPPHDLDPTKQQKTLKSISLFVSPPFLSRWRPRRWRCCPSGAEKTAGLCWRNKSESSDSGFLLRRCRCSTMWWRTGGASFLQWEMWALWWNNPDLIPDRTHTWLFGGSCAHLPLGGTVCSCSALCSVCRKESTGASWHPWQSCRDKDRFYT